MKARKQKGVTLIALVITIIVLIILAGVSINMLVGENGIITQAQKAKEDTEKAKIEEEQAMNLLYDTIMTEGRVNVVDKTVEQIKEEGNYVVGNTQIKDSKGNKVVIPDGFKIAVDSGNNVSEGIVIEDKDLSIDGNGENRGNQFVWVPVGNIIKADGTQTTITLGRYTFAENGTETLVQDAENYTEEIIIESYYKELTTARISNGSDGTDGTNTTAKNLKGFIDSVKINGGYYIARYEAGYRDGTKPYSKVSTGTPRTSVGTPITEGMVWNFINQGNAAKASKAMYTNVNFETDLVNSYAWSTAISYIQKCSGDIDYSMQSSLNTSIANTGKNGDEVCKINDMASNMREWTTEYSTYVDSSHAGPCVSMGYDYTDVNASNRYGSRATSSNAHISFRVILFI